jgi:hypothetical protein
MSRGGRRQGQPGKGYSNRTDLLTNRAPTAPPNLAPPQAGTPQSVAPTQTAAQPAVPPQLNTFAPTAYPHLPVTHGLPSGPGAGPEVLQRPFQPDPLVQAQALLSSLPAVHQTPALRALASAVSASVANGTQAGIAQGV